MATQGVVNNQHLPFSDPLSPPIDYSSSLARLSHHNKLFRTSQQHVVAWSEVEVYT